MNNQSFNLETILALSGDFRGLDLALTRLNLEMWPCFNNDHGDLIFSVFLGFCGFGIHYLLDVMIYKAF